MARKGKDSVVLLNFGSSRIIMAISRPGTTGAAEILAVEESPAVGVRKGTIKDVPTVAGIIGTMRKNLQKRIPVVPERTFVVYGGKGVRVNDHCSRLSLDCRRRVTPGDLKLLVKNAGNEAVTDDFVNLHIIPLRYRLDGQAFSPPTGEGRELEADLRLVRVEKRYIEAVHETVCQAGMRLLKVVFSPLAEVSVVANPAESELGCILLDIGAGKTSVAAFKYGTLLDAVVLPVGLDHVAGDLAVGLRTNISAAEKLLWSVHLNDRDNLPRSLVIPGAVPPESCEKSRFFSIVDARLQEICELIKQSIHSMGLNGLMPGGIKLTGGGADFSGLARYIARYLDLQVDKVPPLVVLSGEKMCPVSLAGLANYCSRKDDNYMHHSKQKNINIFSKVQFLLTGGNGFLRRRDG